MQNKTAKTEAQQHIGNVRRGYEGVQTQLIRCVGAGSIATPYYIRYVILADTRAAILELEGALAALKRLLQIEDPLPPLIDVEGPVEAAGEPGEGP